MRYMVHAEIPAEVGNRLEKEGDPLATLGEVLERWKPESVYLGIARCQLFMVVDLTDSMDLAELTLTITHLFGEYPSIHPVMTPSDFQANPDRIQEVMQRIRQM